MLNQIVSTFKRIFKELSKPLPQKETVKSQIERSTEKIQSGKHISAAEASSIAFKLRTIAFAEGIPLVDFAPYIVMPDKRTAQDWIETEPELFRIFGPEFAKERDLINMRPESVMEGREEEGD